MPKLRKKVGIVWVNKVAFDAILGEAVAHFPRESGGILVGYWTNFISEMVVTNIVGPGPQGVHQNNSFVPDAEYQNEELAKLYKKSDRQLSYLGDWHSHPNGSLQLSRTDRKTLKSIANTPEARAPTPLMAIIANDKRWNFAVWQAIPMQVGRFIIAVKVIPLTIKLY